MNRRTFLAAMPAATVSLATLKVPLLVPVHWEFAVPENEGYYGIDWRRCEFCYEDWLADAVERLPIRQFYLTTDESQLCVCEHCVNDYLKECESTDTCRCGHCE